MTSSMKIPFLQNTRSNFNKFQKIELKEQPFRKQQKVHFWTSYPTDSFCYVELHISISKNFFYLFPKNFQVSKKASELLYLQACLHVFLKALGLTALKQYSTRATEYSNLLPNLYQFLINFVSKWVTWLHSITLLLE